MGNRALIGGFVVATAGLVAFLLLQMAEVSDDGVRVGSLKEAQAGCTPEADTSCLPDFEVTDIRGNTWTRESLRGKAVMVNFWANWCAPCKKETPALVDVYERYADEGLVIIGIHADNGVTPTAVSRFAEQYDVSYPIVDRLDDGIEHAFGRPRGLPTTYLYDRAGNLVFERLGELSEGQIERQVKKALSAAPPSGDGAEPVPDLRRR